jgi:hypothetical protein
MPVLATRQRLVFQHFKTQQLVETPVLVRRRIAVHSQDVENNWRRSDIWWTAVPGGRTAAAHQVTAVLLEFPSLGKRAQ